MIFQFVSPTSIVITFFLIFFTLQGPLVEQYLITRCRLFIEIVRLDDTTINFHDIYTSASVDKMVSRVHIATTFNWKHTHTMLTSFL